MGFRLFGKLRKAQVCATHGPATAGQQGWGAPLQIAYRHRPLPPVDNGGSYAYQTYLAPKYSPIGGGIPNQRDFVDNDRPMVAVQGILVQQVGAPGVLAGQFVSGPLTDVSTAESTMPIPQAASYSIPPQ